MTGTSASEWGRDYDARVGVLEALSQEVMFVLQSAISTAGIKTHSISTRVKQRDSYLEKIQRKAYTDPLDQMTDLVGARVVCLFLDDLPRMEKIVEQGFQVDSREDKIADGPVESFGYMSHHYLCRMPATYTGPRYDVLKDQVFEIQCRTLLQDAWANVSHYLAYKGEASIPAELKRDFHALSGLFYVADRHFQLFYAASEAADEQAILTPPGAQESASSAIDRASMTALLRKICPDRVHASAGDVSELVEEVRAAGYNDRAELERLMREAMPESLEYERVLYADERRPRPFSDLAIARIALGFADDNFARVAYGRTYGKWQKSLRRFRTVLERGS